MNLTLFKKHQKPFAKKQKGAVLVVSLIILLVMTLIALSGMKTSMMQEKMAANAQNMNKTFQAAESAVGALTSTIMSGNSTILSTALTAEDGFAPATSYSVGDSHIDSTVQVEYKGEVIATGGNSISADEDTTTLKGYRFEIIGTGAISGANAQTQVFQGIEYF